MLRPVTAAAASRAASLPSRDAATHRGRAGRDGIADHFHARRIGACIDSDPAALRRVEDRPERDVFVEGLTAAEMHVADRSPTCSLEYVPSILHQEVDEPAIALQEGQHLRRPIGGLDRRRWRRRHTGRQWCGRRAKGIKNVVRDPPVKDQGEERPKGVLQRFP